MNAVKPVAANISLGLSRMKKIMSCLNEPCNAYKSILVAGTNGKGSTCAYISTILSTSGIRTGRFNSPHLVDKSDCITIDNLAVTPEYYKQMESGVLQLIEKNKIEASPFEILTATAFEIFKQKQMEIVVVEVGLGGRLDATNVLPPYNRETGTGVIATGITKVSMDHESLLGDTLAEIATEKAGIIKDQIPCVFDGTNNKEVSNVIRDTGAQKNSKIFAVDGSEEYYGEKVSKLVEMSPLEGKYQTSNLAVALKIIALVKESHYGDKINIDTIMTGISETKWPGRLQHLVLKYNSSEPEVKALLDGAHNESAAIELDSYLNKKIRTSPNDALCFVMTMTKGKNADKILSHLIKPQDTVVITTFGEVEGMPWIACYPTNEMEDQVAKYTGNIIIREKLSDALATANNIGLKIVVSGSLYLVGDALRLHRCISSH